MARILIVDDDPHHGDMYQTKFQNNGYTVDIAPDGVQGLLKIYQNRPDIILLDVLMPKVNGLDFLAKLKSNAKTNTIPVILLTNINGSEEDVQKGLHLGAVAYLVKSKYTPMEILEKVVEILNGYLHNPPTAIPTVTTHIKSQTEE